MKRNVKLLSLLLLLLPCYMFGQAGLYEIKYNGSGSGTSEFFKILDSCYVRFNNVFHFDEDGPGFKYPVSLFTDVDAYKAYVAEKTGTVEPKSETVFLRYSAISRSEVAAVVSPENKNTFIRQLFIQYIYSFIAAPPAWLVNGFSLYFEQYPDLYESPWLEPAKSLYLNENKRIPVKLMLEATKDTYTSDVFLPQSWLFVSFLVEGPYSRNSRFLYDSLQIAVNEAYNDDDPFITYYEKWIDDEQFQKDYDSFVRNLHSVKEDLSAGINAYSEKRIQDAVVLFKRVLDVQLENYTAAYYLALCAYSQKNYKEADSWYKKAMHYGADPALVNWGLGACAYADKRYEEGKVYLLKAKQLDEASYGKKVDDLIMQMP